MSKIIMGIKLMERMKTASKFQELLSEYGCDICTRLGLHVASSDSCSPNGLIILEFKDNADDAAAEFEEKVYKIADATIQKMVF
ncbi:hypothetical protein Ana3638_09275 [Anaerocolumna sedimenticola]|uniref:Uncharacterized protein n=1 Tax=Anaerocolumna sedimenticola TaxID=2696063 RepID=A0A6P1TKW8_9FIRM|nr:hypothetical protein [Anaerocolumna sedimenticola]QHQ60937.1 hypothetical protein Ana3638_09275 [Anaerocolumna sedimenticola]